MLRFYTSREYTCITRRTFQDSEAKNTAWYQSDTPKTHYTPSHCFSIMHYLRWTYPFILYFYREGISFLYSMPTLNSCSLLSQIVKGCFIQQTWHSWTLFLIEAAAHGWYACKTFSVASKIVAKNRYLGTVSPPQRGTPMGADRDWQTEDLCSPHPRSR